LSTPFLVKLFNVQKSMPCQYKCDVNTVSKLHDFTKLHVYLTSFVTDKSTENVN
jgi:hypothetical protein